jgi:NAD(P)-dependent dehydrogenase (short-subunit alcohol dehydrogenase family)
MSPAPVALVTGASSGIGRLAAARLAARGYRVYGTSRAGRLGPPDVAMLSLDVDDDASVRACIDDLLAREGRLDVVVNNAGRAMVGACEETSADEARALFETNVFGVMRVVSRALPAMRARGMGVIINIGSLAGFVGTPFHGVYAASKHALAGYSEALRFEVEPFGVRVVLVEPEAHNTGIQMVRPRSPQAHYDGARGGVEAILRSQIDGGDSPERIVDAIVDAADGNPRPRRRVGATARLMGFVRAALPAALFAFVIRRAFRLAGPASPARMLRPG